MLKCIFVYNNTNIYSPRCYIFIFFLKKILLLKSALPLYIFMCVHVYIRYVYVCVS